MDKPYNITNDYPEYYITPYTFLTVFSILWVCGAVCRALAMPFKLIYGILISIQKLIEGLLYLGRRRRTKSDGVD